MTSLSCGLHLTITPPGCLKLMCGILDDQCQPKKAIKHDDKEEEEDYLLNF